MPRYITTAAQFRPYSFQELIQPLAMYKARYDEINAFAQAQEDASAAARDQAMADPTVRDMWMQYEDALINLRDKIATSGLSTEDYGLANEVRRQFRNQVVPITGAIARREQQRKEWYAAHGNDDTYFGDIPENHNLSEYLNGNIPVLNAYSGDKVAARAAMGAKAISSRQFSQAINQVFGGNFVDFVNRNGIETASNTIMGLLQSGAYPELNELYNGLMQDVNPNYWEDASRYIIRGITDGIVYNETHSYQQNPDAIFERQMTLTEARSAGKRGSGSGSGGSDDISSLRPYDVIEKVKQGIKPKDHTAKGEDVAFLRSLADNPNWYGNRVVRTGRYYNQERLDQINKRHGLNINLDALKNSDGSINQTKVRSVLQKAYDKLYKSWNDEVSLNNDYHFQISNDQYMKDILQARTSGMGEDGGYGMHRVKGNGVTKKLDDDRYNNIDWSKDINLYMLNDGTWQLEVTDKSNKSRVKYTIDPQALTDNPYFSGLVNQYKSLKDKTGEDAAILVDELFNTLYGQYYAMPQIQGATSSKAEPIGYMYYDDEE